MHSCRRARDGIALDAQWLRTEIAALCGVRRTVLRPLVCTIGESMGDRMSCSLASMKDDGPDAGAVGLLPEVVLAPPDDCHDLAVSTQLGVAVADVATEAVLADAVAVAS